MTATPAGSSSVFRGAALVAVLIAPTSAAAQGWELEALAGQLRYESAPALARSSSLVLGLRHAGAQSWFRASAGIPLTEGDPVWGGAGLWRRLAWRRGALALGADVSANTIVYHARVEQGGLLGLDLLPLPDEELTGFGIAGEVMPVVSFGGARARVETRIGAARYHGEIEDATTDRTVTSADARVVLAPAGNVVVSGNVRGHRADESDYVFGGITATVGGGPATLWGAVGHWLSGVSVSSPWAAGAAVRVGERFSLVASGRRDTFDPLYRIPPRTSWSVGATVSVSDRSRIAAPVPASYANGKATIVLRSSEARGSAPRIAGDFNGWKSAPMTREGARWTYTVAVAPGVYNYAFVDANGEWFVPESTPGRKDDGMGGSVATLIVR